MPNKPPIRQISPISPICPIGPITPIKNKITPIIIK